MKKFLLLTVMMVACFCYAFAQQSITGKVTDANGLPLAGVSVTIKGGKRGTTTGPDGQFTISAQRGAVLVFTNVGYTDKEVSVENISTNVILEQSPRSMQEVIITGYNSQNKRAVTGSISKLSGDEVKLQPLGSFDKMLQGKIPGLLSQSQSGQPGAPATVTIRGVGSINGSTDPLYIMDGVEVNANDFQSINPADIESYTVLKDASSTSIYGSRGANGVIVITTKKGVSGKTKIDYDFQYGYTELPTDRLKLMNSAEKLKYEFYDRPDFGSNFFGWTPAEVDSLSKLDFHIKDILFHKGITQQHQISASGGNDKTHFYLSGSIFDQQGVVITTGLKRYTGRINIDNSFGNFKVGLNSTFGYSRFKGTRENDTYIGSPLNAIRWYNPYISLYDADGNYQIDYLQGQPNPLQELLENNGNDDQLKGVGNAFIEFNAPWVKGLKIRTSWGADFTQDESFRYLSRTTDQGSQSQGGNGEVDRAYSKIFRYLGTTSVTFQRSIGDHDINVSIYNEVIQTKSENFAFSGFGLVGPFKNEAGITPGTATNGYIPTVGGSGTQNGLVSFFADAVYGFKRKYFLNAGARRDGSSRLSEDQRWANFGHIGGSWIMTEENFMQGVRGWLNSLKLKASYGSSANQNLANDFITRELFGPTVYNGSGGLVLINLPRTLTWERKVEVNTGVEFTMFKARLGGTVEVYRNTTKDLFLDRQLSRTSGFQSITNNLGKLQNQGVEISLNGDVIRSRDFTWSLEANYTYNKNKLLDQNGQQDNVNGLFINRVGEPINSIYVVRYAGVDPQTGDALYFKKDGKTTTNVYDPDDRVIIGPSIPTKFGGFSSSWNYKGIGLDVMFSYALGGYTYNNDRANVENPIYWFSNLAQIMLKEWQKPGDVTNIPSPFNDFHAETTRFVEKTNYLRLRNVMLSYSLPTAIVGKIKIRSIRIFAQGENLYVWHNFLGYDPEVVTGILGGAHYPPLKTITFGINAGF
ncbi:MAG TPA: TonB-dependent receptor [Chitinophagaceae bacterium]|nr:TonB-dependent receptor [Chitinophagaceae bacterium]